MKKLGLSLFVASALLNGSEFNYGESSDTQTYVADQTTVVTLVSSESGTNFVTSGQSFGASGVYVYTENVNILNIPASFRLNSNFGVNVNLPIVDVRNYGFQQSKDRGLGDLSFGGYYNVGDMSDTFGLNTTTLMYKTATGNRDKGLGSGESAVSISHKIDKGLDGGFSLHGLASYTVNNDKVSGDAYAVMAGASMDGLFSNMLNVSAKVTYLHIDDERDPAVNFFELNSSDLWLSASSQKLITGVPIGFGVKIPLLNEQEDYLVNAGTTTTVDLDKNVMFYVSVSSMF